MRGGTGRGDPKAREPGSDPREPGNQGSLGDSFTKQNANANLSTSKRQVWVPAAEPAPTLLLEFGAGVWYRALVPEFGAGTGSGFGPEEAHGRPMLHSLEHDLTLCPQIFAENGEPQSVHLDGLHCHLDVASAGYRKKVRCKCGARLSVGVGAAVGTFKGLEPRQLRT